MKTIIFRTNNDASASELLAYFQKLNDDNAGKEVAFRVEVDKNRAIRSNDQNARYWAILRAISLAAGGMDQDELHETYKKKFNSKWVLDEQIGGSTKKMNTAQFTEYMNQVEHHARNFFNVIIPHKEDVKYIEWIETVNQDYKNQFRTL